MYLSSSQNLVTFSCAHRETAKDRDCEFQLKTTPNVPFRSTTSGNQSETYRFPLHRVEEVFSIDANREGVDRCEPVAQIHALTKGKGKEVLGHTSSLTKLWRKDQPTQYPRLTSFSLVIVTKHTQI